MKLRKVRSIASGLLLALTMHGCGTWEHASVFVVYSSESAPEEWRWEGASRKRVQDAFNAFSERNGYKCRPGLKRVEEIKCRGPKGLHLVFQPSLNKAEFVAKFTWVDSSDRTHEEFMSHVATFKSELSAAVGKTNIKFEGKT